MRPEQKLVAPYFLAYTVAPGDNLYRIGLKFGVEPDTLQTINGIKRPEALKPGQVIAVPRRVDRPPAAASRADNPKKTTRNVIPAWKDIKKLLKPKSVYIITDVDTGLSLRVVHRWGTLHSDVEPETLKDTEILKTIYGGRWSWTRRAVIAEINGTSYPASMNGMPHGSSSIHDNGFPGVFCVHFFGSRGHASGKVDPDHAKMIEKAFERCQALTY